MKKISLIMTLVLLMGWSSAAKLYFEPSQATVTAGCPMDISVMLDTEGNETTAMDLRIQGDLTTMDFNNFIGQGGIFRAYTAPRITNNSNKATMYVLASTLSRQGINKSGKVGTITVTPKKGAKSMPINFVMVPNVDTDDSNVAVISGDTAVDALSNVINANYTIVEGSCEKEPIAVLTPEKSQTVFIEKNTEVNPEFVPQFAMAERMDKIGMFYAMNRIYFYIGFVVLVLSIISMVLMRRKTGENTTK